MLVSLKRARRTFAASALVMLGLMSSMPQTFAADFKMGVIDPQVILEKTKAGKVGFMIGGRLAALRAWVKEEVR